MCASPLRLLRDGPPPPRVVLLPDALFFARSLPVTPEPAEAAPGKEPVAAMGEQVELALEAAAPFPLAQLYYGYFWVPGSDHALAYASYRRRFTAEQTAAWDRADLVLPTFAAILGAEMAPATTAVLPSPEGLTAVYWGQGPVPSQIAFLPLAADATDPQRALARETLLRRFESKTVVELAGPPLALASDHDGAVNFRIGETRARFSPAAAAALDVRDKDELESLRRAYRRDIHIWRIGVACCAAFLLLAVGELALFGGGLWQQARRVRLNAQAPTVERIIAADEIAHKIEDLRTKRLLPLEMVSIMSEQRPSKNIQFLQAQTSDTDLYSISVRAQTPNPAEIDVFHDKLQALAACQSVTLKPGTSRENVTTFTVSMTFKPGALKPGALPPPT